MNRYHEGQQVEGTVTNVVEFGAFIALDDGLEGLLHLSEMGDGTLKEPHSYVKKSDRLGLRISRLEPDKRRVGFTQRWGVEQPIIEGMEGAEGGAILLPGETLLESVEGAEGAVLETPLASANGGAENGSNGHDDHNEMSEAAPDAEETEEQTGI